MLEIGCGSALCGLTCALKVAHVLSSDSVEDAVTVAKQSADANAISENSIRFECRSWERLELFEEEAFDVVLGSDVLFYRGAAPYVAKVISKSMKLNGCALIADPVRLNVNDFCSRLDVLGLTTQIRQFADSDNAIAKVGALTNGAGKEAFVKLKKAKLVIVQRKDSTTLLSNSIVNAILTMTEPFVGLDE